MKVLAEGARAAARYRQPELPGAGWYQARLRSSGDCARAVPDVAVDQRQAGKDDLGLRRRAIHRARHAARVEEHRRQAHGFRDRGSQVVRYTLAARVVTPPRARASSLLQSTTWNAAEPLIYELDNTDKPHNLSFSGLWDLPFGAGRKLNISNPVGNAFAGNWRFDWIFTYLSGYPVPWPNLINYCGEWHAAAQDEDHWFNNDKSCYKTFPSFNLRTIPDRFPDIRNPSRPQLNVALEKTFRFTERYRLQFRGELFNVTNTPIRPGLNTNFNSASFGKLTKMQNNFPRVIQFAAKLFF